MKQGSIRYVKNIGIKFKGGIMNFLEIFDKVKKSPFIKDGKLYFICPFFKSNIQRIDLVTYEWEFMIRPNCDFQTHFSLHPPLLS